MIRRLHGLIVDKIEDSLVIDCGGVGYRVWITGGDAPTVHKSPTPVTIWIHHAIREDSQDLYGFYDKNDLIFFELLLTVSGIGPKTALGLIATATVQTLRRGIQSKDPVYLSKISGIGKKTAEKIVFELGDKLTVGEGEEKHAGASQEDHDTLEALVVLGYDEKKIRSILKDMPAEFSQKEKLKKAISSLSKK